MVGLILIIDHLSCYSDFLLSLCLFLLDLLRLIDLKSVFVQVTQ